jgi:predicted ArsR family transcriptional regulator
MSEQPRSRRQTRAAILGHLLQSGGMFRPHLANAVRLSEASLSRVLLDLKAEALIAELRRAAPYFGGPTALVSLNGSVALADREHAECEAMSWYRHLRLAVTYGGR